jgi:GT2 family glycosyltransferase
VTEGSDRALGVTAIVPTLSPRKELRLVLDTLADLPLDEVIVVENGPNPELEGRQGVRIVRPARNLGIGGRNLAAREAKTELLLMLDDDSYPLPGAIEELTRAFRRDPRLGVAGGLVRDVDLERGTEVERGSNTFDWWLRAGRDEPTSDTGLPAFFFPAGACMVRRDAFLEVGGFFEVYFHSQGELDLATRMLAEGWDVRYLPSARFVHLKAATGREKSEMLQLRVRNQVWYFYRHFPALVAARRMPAYLLFDLIEATKSRALGAWARGVLDSWRERDQVRGTRRPLPRALVRRAELNRGRMHLRLLADRAARLAQARRRNT